MDRPKNTRTVKYYHPEVYQRFLGPILMLGKCQDIVSDFLSQGFADIELDREFHDLNLIDVFVDVCWQKNIPAIVAISWPDFMVLYELKIFTPPSESWFSYAVNTGNVPPYPVLFKNGGHDTCDWKQGGVTRFNTHHGLITAARSVVTAYEASGIKVKCKDVEIPIQTVLVGD